jgi:hypothetical protein
MEPDGAACVLAKAPAALTPAVPPSARMRIFDEMRAKAVAGSRWAVPWSSVVDEISRTLSGLVPTFADG